MWIADELESRRDEIVDAGLRLIQKRMTVYRDMDPALLADVRSHIAQHHDLLVAVMRRRRAARAREFDFVGRHAALRARRGVTLADFLQAFRAYHSVLWDEVRSHDDVSAALEAARTIMVHIDLATTEASAAFLDARQLLLADADRVQRDLLEDLLESGVPGTAARLAVARHAGLTDDARCLLVAAVPTVMPDDDAVLRRAAGDLARAVTSALTVTRHGEIVLVLAVRDARPALVEPLEQARRRIAKYAPALAIGVSTVHDSVADLGDAYDEASMMVSRVVESGGVLSLPDLGPFDYLTLGGDDVARRLIAPEIERFIAEDRGHGDVLTRTLTAYAAADLNVKAAAEELLIHVNTAHYRLGRIAEKTGRDLRRLPDLIDLLVAVRLLGKP